MPDPDCISTFSPFPSSPILQSKHCTIAATAVFIKLNASVVPGHPLLPPPNGTKLNFILSLSSSCSFKNLSGRNSLGWSQESGSLIMAYKFIATAVFGGTSKPFILQCWRHSLVSLSVSFTTACKYGMLGTSDSSTSLTLPVTNSISFLTLSNASGWLRSSAIAHCIASAEVSVPAMNRSLPQE
ncbi:hypothetical protein CR513_53784, partial [Mucuna pruriens]